jgi:ferrous iron transport protein B
MQCLPTLAVTRRETGSWSWALLQLGYMTIIAYVFAFITFVIVRAMTGGV